MKIISLRNKNEISKKVSLILFSEIKKNPNLVLGLATGKTMIPIYKEFIKIVKKSRLELRKIKTFNLDEYHNVNNTNSMRNFMEKFFYNPLKIKKSQIHFLKNGENLRKTCRDYEISIIKSGGIDLQLLGIGRNGHVAFNEPGSPINSRCRLVTLANSTRIDAIKEFGSLEKVPIKALTLGIKNILQSKKIILIAFRKYKADAIKKAIDGPITKKIPASFLRKHKDVTIILDKEAGSLLKKI